MRTTIDASGRLVIPKPLRDRIRLDAGEVEVIERDGVIEVRPAPAEVEIVATAEGPVAESRTPLPPLTDDLVRDTVERMRP